MYVYSTEAEQAAMRECGAGLRLRQKRIQLRQSFDLVPGSNQALTTLKRWACVRLLVSTVLAGKFSLLSIY